MNMHTLLYIFTDNSILGRTGEGKELGLSSSYSRVVLCRGGVKAKVEPRDLRVRRVLWPYLLLAIIGAPGRMAFNLELTASQLFQAAF